LVLQVLAIKFVPFAIEFVTLTIKFIALAIELVTLAIEFLVFGEKFICNKIGSCSKHENKMQQLLQDLVQVQLQ